MKTRRDPLPTAEGNLVFIEYHGRHSFSAIVVDDKGCPSTYNLEWSRTRKTLYSEMSGIGGHANQTICLHPFVTPGIRASVWAAEGWSFTTPGKKGSEVPISDKRLKSLGYRRICAPRRDPFEAAIEGSTYWCGVCRDWLPEEPGEHCRHVLWIEGGWYGCGADNETDHSRASLAALMNLMGEETRIPLCRSLREGNFRNGMRGEITDISDLDFEVDNGLSLFKNFLLPSSHRSPITDEALRGVAWLMSLSVRTTRKWNRITAGWIEEWWMEKQKQRSRTAAVPGTEAEAR